jgi:hypothetical protein
MDNVQVFDVTECGLTDEELVVAWQTSNSVSGAATKLGVPWYVMDAWAHQYRQAGVNLKDMAVASAN